jgi:dGTPase
MKRRCGQRKKPMTMEWKKLLNAKRLRAEHPPKADDRRGYERDYDRVLFSLPFRRLLDKTQVFPMPANDHIHNRLIHSVEVASVGRTLGTWAGERLLEAGVDLGGVAASALGDIVASACLMHDIGNPPFGHAGEDAIASWFKSWLGKEDNKAVHDGLTDAEKMDLQQFEGNAQSFRVVTRLEMYGEESGGMQLTLATLGAVAKYPQASIHHADDKRNENRQKHVARKKFNYFQADQVAFTEVAEGLGLSLVEDRAWARHPLAYLVEAADDICYRILDLEDGYTLGLVGEAQLSDLLIKAHGRRPSTNPKSPRERIAYLRARAINELVKQVVDAFILHHDSLLEGTLDRSLEKLIPAAPALEKIREVSTKLCYDAPEVLRIELAGYEVLGGLLKVFVPAVLANKPDDRQKRALKLMHFQPPTKDSAYSRLLSVTDYLSGMTDGYALRLYKELLGIELPGVQGRVSQSDNKTWTRPTLSKTENLRTLFNKRSK